MRKIMFVAVIVAAAALVAANAMAGPQSYSNAEFKFAMEYPEGWKMKEETPKMEVDVGEAAFGFKIGKKVDVGQQVGMPKMLNVCFSSKKCSPGSSSKHPEIDLMITDLKSTEKLAKKMQGSASSSKKGKDDGDKGEKAKSECDLIEKGRKTWASKKSTFMTMRCPEKKKWRYTTSIHMNRKYAGMSNMYMLECSMLSKSKDKAESLTEYQNEFKPKCNAAISSAKMMK